MMRWFVYGDGGAPLNLGQIAGRLMDLDIPLSVGAKGHKARDPELVTFAQVRSVITNPMFIARWRHRGEEYDFWDKLAVSKDGAPKSTAIPVDLFEAVKSRLLEIERPGMANDRTSRICSGLAVCACCGLSLHVNVKAYVNGDRFERYYCSHRAGRRKTCTEDGYASLAVAELERWVRQQLTPQLVEELDSMRAESGTKTIRKDLQIAERNLAGARKTETEKLTALVGAMDPDQFAAVAMQLKADRQRLEREVNDLKDRIRQIEEPIDIVPMSLESVCSDRLREALRRAVKFIALSSQGVTVLTRSGSYLTAPIIDRDLSIYSEADNRRRISPTISPGDLSWIPNHDKFIAGRRRSLGKSSDRLTDEQLLHEPEVRLGSTRSSLPVLLRGFQNWIGGFAKLCGITQSLWPMSRRKPLPRRKLSSPRPRIPRPTPCPPFARASLTSCRRRLSPKKPRSPTCQSANSG